MVLNKDRQLRTGDNGGEVGKYAPVPVQAVGDVAFQSFVVLNVRGNGLLL